MSNKVKVFFECPASDAGTYERVSVTDGSGGTLQISFRRTIRIPDNNQGYSSPPELEPFPMYSVNESDVNLSKKIVSKGGIFVPMYRKYTRHLEQYNTNHSTERAAM